MNNELIGIISNEGELKGAIEDNSFNAIVQITESDPTGKGLEFIWNGTQLGVRVEGEAQYQYVDLKGEKGIQGDTGNGISSIVRTSGTGAAGTTDTYTITFTNGSTTTFQVYNGADGIDGTNGYTPIRGTDYWTEADQTAIVADVLAALPNGDGVSY